MKFIAVIWFSHCCSEIHSASRYSWSIERPHQWRPDCWIPRQVRQLRTS